MAQSKGAEKKDYGWKLQEIVFVAMSCIVLGVVYLAAVYLSAFINTAGTPVGLGFLGNELLFGVWFMASTFAAYIIQKPGVALVSEILAALIEVLLGNMYGPMVIVTGLVQGIGSEIAFAAFRYRRFDWTTMTLAAFPLLRHQLRLELRSLRLRRARLWPARAVLRHPPRELRRLLRRHLQGRGGQAGGHGSAQGLRSRPLA